MIAAAAVVALLPAPARTQSASTLAGIWALNRSLSELPREIGFKADWISAPSAGGQSGGTNSGGGRGRRGSGGGGGTRGGAAAPFSPSRQSYEDAQRLQLLTAEVRNPPARLIIVDTPAAVTITNELGQSRTLHPDGKEESIVLQGVPFSVTTKRDGDHLVVDYRVEQDREVRYTYSRTTTTGSQLIVEVQFLERGAGDKARRVYEPGVETAAATPPTAAPAASAPPATAAAASSLKPPAPEAFDARPGAELKGLKSLGVLVEDLGAQAVTCGLNQEVLETAVSKRLTDAGFSVRKNSDDDTYVYVNVISTGLASGTCVSRYDVFLYTHATAKLSYHDQPVLVQVSLIHRGGIGSSVPAAHAGAVGRGLEGYIDLFVTQIRDANK